MPKKPTRSRIIGLEMVDPRQLLAHPWNPKKHPGPQREVMRGLMDSVGWVAPMIHNQRTGHTLDGHMRIEEAITKGDETIPVLVVDVAEEEEPTVLLMFDQMRALAEPDPENIKRLLNDLDEVGEQDARLVQFLANLRGDVELPGNEWDGMPEFAQEDQGAVFQAHINFQSMADVQAFEDFIGQAIPKHTKSIWWPKRERANFKAQGYTATPSADKPVEPQEQDGHA